MLRIGDGHILKRALDFVIEGQRKKGRQKRTWKRLVVKEIVKVGLGKEDVLYQLKWSVGVNKIAVGLR